MSDEDDFFKALEEAYTDDEFQFDLGRPKPPTEMPDPVWDGRPSKVGDCFAIDIGVYTGRTYKCLELRPHAMYQYICVWREEPGTKGDDPMLAFFGNVNFDFYSRLGVLRRVKPRGHYINDDYVYQGIKIYQRKAKEKGPEGKK